MEWYISDILECRFPTDSSVIVTFRERNSVRIDASWDWYWPELNLPWGFTQDVSYNQVMSHFSDVVDSIPGPRFNIKMSSYQYRKSRCGDKTVVRSSYLHNGISYTGKMSSLYWIGSQFAITDFLMPGQYHCILVWKFREGCSPISLNETDLNQAILCTLSHYPKFFKEE